MKTKTMLKLMLLTALVGAAAVPARAARFWNVEVYASSGSLHIGWADNSGSLRPGLNSDRVFTSSGAAVVQSTSTTAGYKPFRVLSAAAVELLSITQNGLVTAATFVGNLTGNVTGNLTGDVTGNLTGTASNATLAATATALAANGANCSAGQYPLGVDASGAVETCTPAGVGDAVLSSTQNWTGSNNFTQPSSTVTITANFNGCVWVSSMDVTGQGISYATITIPSEMQKSSQTWAVHWTEVTPSSAVPNPFGWFVNGISTGTDYAAGFGGVWNGATQLYQAINAGRMAELYYIGTNNANTDDSGFGWTYFRTLAKGKRIAAYTTGMFYSAQAAQGTQIVNSAGSYKGIAPNGITSITLCGSAGAHTATCTGTAPFTGHFELWRCGQKGF